MKPVTVEHKYAVADKLALAYKGKFSDDMLSSNRAVVFGVIINTINSKGKSLSQIFTEDDSIHITNLTIQKLSHKFEPVICDF